MHDNQKRILSTAALALAMGTAVTLASAHDMATPANQEKCFGVALKGKNDCAGGPGTSCAGTSKVDYQADAWKLVPAGTCVKTVSPTSPTGYGQKAAFKPKKV